MPYQYPKRREILAIILEIAFFLFFKIRKLFRKRSIITETYSSFLIIEPFQLGDVISLSVMFDRILNSNPTARIYLLTKKGTGAIFKKDTRITAVLEMNFPWSNYKFRKTPLLEYLAFFKDLRRLGGKYCFQYGIDTRGDIRSQIVLNYLNVETVLGYKNYISSNINVLGLLLNKCLTKPSRKHKYYWNLEILDTIFADNYSDIVLPSLRSECIEPSADQYILIHPGGGWHYKMWNQQNWVDLISLISQKLPYRIRIVGAPNEQETLDFLRGNTASHVSINITSIDELFCNIAGSKIFICLDSGPMNIATCLNKPVLALFGPGDSEMWSPLSSNSSFIHLNETYPCNPCQQMKCYYPEKSCMSVISVSMVYEKLIEQLSTIS